MGGDLHRGHLHRCRQLHAARLDDARTGRPLPDPHVRGSLAIFFAKTRMRWKETVVNSHKEHVGGPIEYQEVKDVRQRFLDRIARIRNAGKTGGSSEG